MRNARKMIAMALICAVTGASAAAFAQTAPVPSSSAVEPTYVPAAPVVQAVPQLTAGQLDNITGPIALYPDPLLANVLAASTYPSEVAAATQWISLNPQPSEAALAVQPWQPAVKALVHYPSVLLLLGQNIAWTQTLGQAYVTQPADITAAVQRLRGQALAAGTLTSSPQQSVLVTNGTIQIVPANPTIVYVPRYDTRWVYTRHPGVRGAVITFGGGVSIGSWMDFDLDWGLHHVVVGVSHDRGWYDHRGRPDGHVQEWHPPVVVRGPIIVNRPGPDMRGRDFDHGPADHRDDHRDNDHRDNDHRGDRHDGRDWH